MHTTRAMRKVSTIDRIIKKMSDSRTLAALFLYSCLVAAGIVCFVMLQSVYGTYLWWTTTVEGQLAAETHPDELYRNCWWSVLTIVNNVAFISLFLKVIVGRLQQLDAIKYSIYPTIPHTGFLIGVFSSLYFITAIWSLVSNNLQLLLKRQLVTISGTWQDLFPYHKMNGFQDDQGIFMISWNAFWSFNIEMFIYFLVVTMLLNFLSQFILSYYTYVIEAGIPFEKEGNKSNTISNNDKGCSLADK